MTWWLLFYKFLFNKSNLEVRIHRLVFSTKPFIPHPLIFDDGVCVCVAKPLTSWSEIIVLVQPICNLLIVQPVIKFVGNQVIEMMLVIVVMIYSPKVVCTNHHLEGYENINIL